MQGGPSPVAPVVLPPSGGGDPTEPVFQQGVNTSYYFETFASYANGAAMGSGGGGDYFYLLTETPVLSTNSPTGSAGRKATSTRTAPDSGGHWEWSPNFSGFSLPSTLPVTIVTWLWRTTGVQYEGKGLIHEQVSGNFRYVCQPHILQGAIPAALHDAYWNANGTGKFADTPDVGVPCWGIWHDGIPAPDQPAWFDANGFCMYHHNVGKSFDQSIYLDSATLIRHTLRLTTPSTGGYGGGKGRIEMWIGGLKTHEWIGDDAGRPEFGLVLVQTPRPVDLWQCPGPSAHNFSGTATIEYSDVRIWAP